MEDFMQWWAVNNVARENVGLPEADFAEARHWFWADEDNQVRREHAPGKVFSPIEAAQAAKWGCRS
jgi:hypothetical protein